MTSLEHKDLFFLVSHARYMGIHIGWHANNARLYRVCVLCVCSSEDQLCVCVHTQDVR